MAALLLVTSTYVGAYLDMPSAVVEPTVDMHRSEVVFHTNLHAA